MIIGLAASIWILFCQPARSQEPPASPTLSSWVVYWDLPGSFQQASASIHALKNISLFCYHFDRNGRLVPASPALMTLLPKLKALAPPGALGIWLTVTNDVEKSPRATRLKDPAMIHALLSHTARRSAHIAELTALAGPVDGIEIDYENLQARDREAFSTFLTELAGALHRRSRKLAVVVQAKTDDRAGDGARAIDWRAAATVADGVKVMAYHFHHASGSPGPIAPPAWVDRLARFALERIPREKLAIVFTLSGFDWPPYQPGRSVDSIAALRLAKARQVPQERDLESDSPHFSYKDDAGLRHEVWFEDAESLRRKIETAASLGITELAFWRLGSGDPSFWAGLPAKSPQITP